MPALDKPLTRVCIRLWADDYEKLRRVCEAQGDLGLNMVIRTIVHDYVMRLNDRERKAIDAIAEYKPAEPVNPLDLET